jgi:hypothetical protein
MKKFLIVFAVALALPAALMAADGIVIDVGQAELIFLAGVGGFSVMALVELAKRLLKTTGLGTRIVSVIVSAGAVAYYLVTTSHFDPLRFVIFTAVVALAANGIYLFPQKR